MNFKEFFNQHKKPILYWLIFGAVVLIVGGTIWWSWSENLKINNTEMEPVEIIEPNLCGPEPPVECEAGARLTCVNEKWSCREIEEKQKIIGKITFSNIEGGCWGFQSDNGRYFFIGGDDKSEEIKKIPDILSKNVEIQGKIEKDIVSFCPVGEGLFELESYRIINDNTTDTSKLESLSE